MTSIIPETDDILPMLRAAYPDIEDEVILFRDSGFNSSDRALTAMWRRLYAWHRAEVLIAVAKATIPVEGLRTALKICALATGGPDTETNRFIIETVEAALR